MTDAALVKHAEWIGATQSPSGLRTRRRELTDAGFVRFTGSFNVLRSGRRARIWEATT
jgi:hypothetical protein